MLLAVAPTWVVAVSIDPIGCSVQVARAVGRHDVWHVERLACILQRRGGQLFLQPATAALRWQRRRWRRRRRRGWAGRRRRRGAWRRAGAVGLVETAPAERGRAGHRRRRTGRRRRWHGWRSAIGRQLPQVPAAEVGPVAGRRWRCAARRVWVAPAVEVLKERVWVQDLLHWQWLAVRRDHARAAATPF